MRALLVIGLALLLGACAGQPTRTAPPLSREQQAAFAQAYQAERSNLRRAWMLSGRIAVSTDGRGGSGRIDWTQAGERFDIALSAPVTRQSWRLSGHRDSARLEGLDGGAREGLDASTLLQESTGWTIPVDCLPDWVLGFGCEFVSTVPIQTWGEDGRPASIQELGWVIEYQAWHEAADGQPALPRRIFARSTTTKATVRLVIDEWQPQAATGAAPPGASWTSNWAAALSRADGEGLVDSSVEQLAAELASRDLHNPEADMRRRVAAGDARPLAVCGYSCEAPGLPVGWNGDAPHILDNTGDVIWSHRQVQLKAQASDYATRYNRALGKWLALTGPERHQAPPPVADAGPQPRF